MQSTILIALSVVVIALVISFRLVWSRVINQYRQNEVVYRRALKVMECVDEMKTIRIEQLESELREIREES